MAGTRVRAIAARGVIAILVAASLASCGAPGDAVRVLDEPLPELEGVDLDGRALSSDRFAGSVLVVNAWASWCAPCTEEMPMLVEVAERYAERGVRFVGIDHADQLAEARRFADGFGLTYPSFVDQAGRFAAVLGYPGLPATYVVDAGGTMRFAVYDRIEESTLVRLLDEVLAGSAPSASPASGA